MLRTNAVLMRTESLRQFDAVKTGKTEIVKNFRLRSTPAAPALRSTCAHPSSNVSRRDTLSIKLCHLPPLTPLCRAANIASVQIGAGANFRFMELPSALASRLGKD